MSSKDVTAVSSATGKFQALQSVSSADNAAEEARATGGNGVPRAAMPDLEKLTAKLNLASETIGRDLRFKIDMASGSSVIQVLDRDTGEIIRQIPPDEAEVTLTQNGFVELKLFDGSA